MATYIELHTLRGSESIAALRQKISVAIAIKANALAKAAPNATQKAWAKSALASQTDAVRSCTTTPRLRGPQPDKGLLGCT